MRVDDYKNACRLAAEKLARMDAGAVARDAGALWINQGFQFDFFGRAVRVAAPAMAVNWLEPKEGEDFSLTDAVLALHYLVGAKGLSPTGDLVAYRQISGGEFYAAAFHRRAEEPLAKTFGGAPGLLTRAVEALNGEKFAGHGDEAGRFRVLPHLDLVVLLHWADDEFESGGQVLFDRIIASYLHIEDIAWLGSALVYRLMGAARKLV